MNKIYRLVWSHRLQATVIAPETARGKGKSGLVSKVVSIVGIAVLASQNALAFAPIGTGATSTTVTSPGAAGNLVIGDNASATNSIQTCGNPDDILGNPYLNGGCASSTVIGNNATNNGFAASLVLGESAQVTGTGSTAIGSLSTAATNALAAGFGAEASANGSTALGQGSLASGINSVAIGKGAFTYGDQSIALGINAGVGEGTNPIPGSTFGNQGDNIAIGDNAGNTVLGAKNVALGRSSGSNVSGNENTAFGSGTGSNIYGFDNVAFGPNSGNNITGGAFDTGNNNTAVGPHSGNDVAGGGNVAVGQDAGNSVNANQTVSIGHVANAGGDASIAIGNNSSVSAGVTNAIAQGTSTTVSGNSSIGIGEAANITGIQSVGIGYHSTIAGNNSYAIGSSNTVNSNNVAVLGNNITVATGLDNSVVLGSGSSVAAAVGTSSTTLNGQQYNFAGVSPNASVSIGTTTSQRTLTNLAAGRINSLSTDAVNGSQLFASNTAINNLGDNLNTLDSQAVKYDLNPDNSVNYNSVTMGGTTYDYSTHTGGTTITNVADGAAPSDAVNFSQLTQTNTQIANIYN
ncbi:MAG: adhesin, partial [Yokenella regensburgei]|nr:adhesin [Yokenella regensburgei]